MRRLVYASFGLCVSLALLEGCVTPAPHAAHHAQASGWQWLPARVRRLSNAEYEQTVSEILGAPQHVAERLPPDARQEGYTRSADQSLPAAFAARLDALAREMARETVKNRLATLAPCSTKDDVPCADKLVEALGQRAYRRPLAPDERRSLLQAFTDGAREGGFATGAEVVLRMVLQSPNLLYLTELGPVDATGPVVTLTPYEIASALSYTVRGGPPDEALLAAAAAGTLSSPAVREAQARRLIGESETRHHFRRFVLEWLEVDGLERTAKSNALFPEYERLRSHMLEETADFTDEVMVHGGASIRSLLAANFTSVDPSMARFYGMKTYGPEASLAGTGRAGILQHASFLAAHAHEDGTSPVKRGDFVLRKLLCEKVKRPAEVGIEIVIPPVSSAETTRERFAMHTEVAACSECHAALDAVGFTFENFDAMGASRSRENGHPVDSSADVHLPGAARHFANSVELSRWLADDPRVSECFARHALRYFSAQSDPAIENEFLALRGELSPALAGSLVEELVLFVKSDLFVRREVRSR